jgi:CRISPR system Cascade subunit CasC
VQVAHAVTTHKTMIEDDYYTAVDDLKKPSEDAGAGFLGEAGFGAGVFYLYACIDRDLLRQNLGGDDALAGIACAALVEAAATVAPSGKQASFASRARASYILAERGTDQPRALTAAFLKPVDETEEGGVMATSIKELTKLNTAIAKAYGDGSGPKAEMNVLTGKGTLEDIKAFCRAGI